MPSISEIRKEYVLAALEVTDVSLDPIVQFNKWFTEAVQAQVMEPNAMTLATVDSEGKPSARIVLLKDVTDNKFVFYTNYQSQKGKELEQNPACALTFFWPELERQVRISGVASRVSAATSETYFQSRPRASQIGAWSSPQSSVIKDRSILEDRVKAMKQRFDGKPVLPKPHQWGGYEITPTQIEFWQGRPSRLHDRIAYYLGNSGWEIFRLAP
ncbi:MAG: pyridoxamine 5'-phosphate oxidase [Cyclobacteriaceae bacterium]|nr:pyridoxamine 5'-phosphate oxidase [Cyclobacteriaceae bacterium]